MQRGERDLRRADEVEAVPLDRVDVHLVRREEPGAVHRLLADEHGREHGGEALLDETVEREAVERELEERDVADPVHEPRARDARAALEVDPAVRGREVDVVLHRKVERRGLADAPDLDRVLLREPVGRGHVRRVRHAVEERLPCRLGLTELVLEPLEVDLDLLQLLELLGRRLPLQLRPPAELVDLRYERPPALVGLEQLVEDPRRLVALADEGGAKRVRIGPGGLEVDHGRSLGSRRAASRRPRSRRTRRRRRSPARRASPRRTASHPGRS